MNESVNNAVQRETKIQPVLALKSTGGNVLPLMAHTGRLRPKRGTIFRLHVYKRVEISPVEVYEKGGKSVRKKAENSKHKDMAVKMSTKFPGFVIYQRDSQLPQTANVRLKLRISQNRK